jgi:hypothetical protein
MQARFRPSTRSDVAGLVELMARVYEAPPDTPFLRPEILEWKYWIARDDWAEPRSYVGELDGKLVAHIGVWPCTIDVNGASRRGVHFFDWAADPTAVGGGIAVMQHAMRGFDFSYAIGGTPIAKTIMRRIGFLPVATAWKAARPLRAVRMVGTQPSGGWRLPARLGRNILWSAVPRAAAPRGWEFEPADPVRIAGASSGMLEIPRSSAFLQYLARCPMCRCRTFRVTEHGRDRGCFVLAMVRHQARLAVWIDDPGPEAHRIVYALAQDAARTIPDVFEIAVMGSSQATADAAVAAGFRLRKTDDVRIIDRTKVWPSGPPQLQFQNCDNDGIFLDDGEASFMC